jgi:tetratricopeptide (TPR) repeat protein
MLFKNSISNITEETVRVAKERCQICGIEKAKRTCKIKDALQICSVCCAKLRSDGCGNCTYHEASVRYHSEKSEKPTKEKPFIALMNPEIDEECDRILSLVDSGHLARGERQMKELYQKYPDYHAVLYGLGVCYALQDKFEEAVDFFKRAVAIFPYLTEAHFNMAMAYLQLGDISGVVRAFREVIRVGRDDELVSEARRRLADLERGSVELTGLSLDTFLKNSET